MTNELGVSNCDCNSMKVIHNCQLSTGAVLIAMNLNGDTQFNFKIKLAEW